MVKYALDQSNFEILKSVVSQEASDFFACWGRMKEYKSWFEYFYFFEVKKALSQSDYENPESALSQVKID